MRIKDILKISNAKLLMGKEDYLFKGFSKDTRTIKPGDTYVGIRGENFDGNLFFEDAFLKGADVCILEHIDLTDEIKERFFDKNIIVVDHSLDFLMEAAQKKRKEIMVPVIAITGSVGKTSTKTIVADTLEAKYTVLRTIGNENSRIGMSLRILNYDHEDCIVLEMGMNHAGEIRELTHIAKPNYAIITNVGTSHIGNLGSRENILRAKLEILEGLSGPIIVNYDNDLLHEWVDSKPDYNIITFGIHEESDYQAKNIQYTQKGSTYELNGEEVFIPVIGDAFIYNSLVAFVMGDLFQISHEHIKQVLNKLKLEPHRMEFINHNDYIIIDDTYNASYDSVSYSLDVLSHFSERKIAVLGDILELGDFSEKIHRKIGKLIVEKKIDMLVTVGDAAKFINEEAIKNGYPSQNSFHFPNNERAIHFLKKSIKKDDIVLVKASHGMKFLDIVNALKEESWTLMN